MSGRWDRSASSTWGRQGRGSGTGSWLGLATQMMFLPFQMLGWGTQLMTGAGQGLQGQGLQGLGDCGCGGRGRGGGGGWNQGRGDGGGYGGSWNRGQGESGGWNRDVGGGGDWNRPGWTGGTGAPDWSRQAAPPPPAWPAPAYTPPNPPQNSGAGTEGAAGAVPNRAETKRREEKDMACDTDLSGTDLKIIEYTIVSVDPDIENDWERVIQDTTTVATTQDMTENGFIAWVIALFFQRPSDARRRAEERFGGGENWKQYLRVCYCVKCRMAIPESDCCQEQANALRDINRTLKRIADDKGRDSGDNLPAKTR